MTKKIINIPDLGEAEDVEVIEICVKAGDQVDSEDPIKSLERHASSKSPNMDLAGAAGRSPNQKTLEPESRPLFTICRQSSMPSLPGPCTR